MNFSSTQKSSNKKEFQAIVFAGYGTNLYPLTTQDGTECKALLPIGNEPMISYTLNWLEAGGITDVIVLTPSAYEQALSAHLMEYTSGMGSEGAMKIRLVGVEDADLGDGRQTATILRRHSSLITSDFIVLPCDFIPTPTLPLTKLLDAHRTRTNSTFTALFYEREYIKEGGPDQILVGIDGKGGRLLFVDEMEDGEEFDLRMSLLRKNPGMQLYTNLLDAHVYVFRQETLKLLHHYKQIESIRSELIPWLIKGSYQTLLSEQWRPVLLSTPDPLELALSHSSSYLTPQHQSPYNPTSSTSSISAPYAKKQLPALDNESLSTLVRSSNPDTSSSSGLNAKSFRPPAMARIDSEWEGSGSDTPRRIGREEGEDQGTNQGPVVNCGIVIHPLKDGFVARANTIPTYLELNRQFLKAHVMSGLTSAQLLTSKQPPLTPSSIDPKAQISTDSVIGSSSKVGERTNVKKTIVGHHCSIGKNVKLVNCVLMDFVEVADGAKLEDTIICRQVKVGEKTSLRECVVGPNMKIPSGQDFKAEKLIDDRDV